MIPDPRISMVPSCTDHGANPDTSPHPSGKQNRTQVECLSRQGTHPLDLLLSQVRCPDTANLIIFDACTFQTLLGPLVCRHDLDPNPELPGLAVYTGQVDEIMTQLSAWLSDSGCREYPGKIYFQTYLPSV